MITVLICMCIIQSGEMIVLLFIPTIWGRPEKVEL